VIRELKTDFEFKDRRTYVHSSTMIRELTRQIYENYYPEGKWNDPKVDAKFHKTVLHNGVFKLSENQSDLNDCDLANTTFCFFDDNQSISAAFHENEDIGVDRRIKTNYTVDSIALEKKFSGSCKIGCLSKESFVENVIEANKRIHLLTVEDRNCDVEVINLYMRKFPVSLPVNVSIDYGKLLLNIENISSRQLDKSIVTLNSFSFPELDIDHFEMSFIMKEI